MSLGSDEAAVIGLLLTIRSTSVKSIERNSSVKTDPPAITFKTHLTEPIIRSHTPPWWLAAGGLNFHVTPRHANKELVVQNLRREQHSSETVRRFRKQKSCCHVIAIPSGWHRCPNPNYKAKFWSQKKIAPCSFSHPSFYSVLFHSTQSQPQYDGWKLSMITTTPCCLQQCNDKMSYLHQMYEKKAIEGHA